MDVAIRIQTDRHVHLDHCGLGGLIVGKERNHHLLIAGRANLLARLLSLNQAGSLKYLDIYRACGLGDVEPLCELADIVWLVIQDLDDLSPQWRVQSSDDASRALLVC
jgi:hypothetical protein